MFVLEVNGKPQLNSPSLEKAKRLAQSYLRDGNLVRIRPGDGIGRNTEYFYDPTAIAWVKLDRGDSQGSFASVQP